MGDTGVGVKIALLQPCRLCGAIVFCVLSAASLAYPHLTVLGQESNIYGVPRGSCGCSLRVTGQQQHGNADGHGQDTHIRNAANVTAAAAAVGRVNRTHDA